MQHKYIVDTQTSFWLAATCLCGVWTTQLSLPWKMSCMQCQSIQTPTPESWGKTRRCRRSSSCVFVRLAVSLCVCVKSSATPQPDAEPPCRPGRPPPTPPLFAALSRPLSAPQPLASSLPLYCLCTLPADTPTATIDQSERRAAVRSSATMMPSRSVRIHRSSVAAV